MIVDLGAFIEKIRKDFAFRTLVFSCCSLAAEIAYAAFNFVVCTIYRSTWYGAAGCYQLALAIMRGGVLYRRNADAKRAPARADVREIRRYAACGGAIALLTVFLSAMVVLIAGRAKTFIYSPTVMYIHAGYTFYVLGAAVYNFFKSRRQKNFTVRTLRCIFGISPRSCKTIFAASKSMPADIPLIKCRYPLSTASCTAIFNFSSIFASHSLSLPQG